MKASSSLGLLVCLAPLVLASLSIGIAASQNKPKPEPQKSTPAREDFTDLDSLSKSLPSATVKPLDSHSALLLTALPLACLDDLQPKPTARVYFWQPTYRTVEGHDKIRAFYGCNDWQTSASATWTLVTLLKRYPELPVGGLIREKLTDHLGRSNLEGELAYFKMAGGFQRPYGYAWLLKLHAELSTWKDADGARYADNVQPLARYFAESLLTFLIDLDRPNRTAGQANSAFAFGLLLDYVEITRDTTIGRAVNETARRLFASDTDCATDTEAASPELVSPCLAEAALMSRVLDREAFVPWLDKFLPAAHTNKFKPLRSVSLDAVGTGRRGGGRGQRGTETTPADTTAQPPPAGQRGAEPPPTGERGALPDATPGEAGQTAGAATAAGNDPGAANTGGRGAPPVSPRATWAGLALTRADAFARVADALPPNDPRVAVFRKLAAIHAETGQKGLNDPAAFDAPSLGAFAVSYLTTTGSQR